MWWDTLTSGVIAGLVVVVATSLSAMWLRRHRVRLVGVFDLGPNWYMIHVFNDGGRPVHVFEAWLERDGKRFKAEEALSLRGRNIEPYSEWMGSFNATHANTYLGGNPRRGCVKVNGTIRRVYTATIPPKEPEPGRAQ